MSLLGFSIRPTAVTQVGWVDYHELSGFFTVASESCKKFLRLMALWL